MLKVIRRATTGIVAALAAGALLAGPALAEGSWSSTMDSWMVGKSSRTWFDNDSDSASTTLTLGGCRTTNGVKPGGLRFTLVKHRTALPGKAVGTNGISCVSYNTNTAWGAQDRAYYHLNFVDVVNGPTRYYSAHTFRVSY